MTGARELVALEGLDLDVAPGEFFGLLGPNGAGKTTTIGILTTRVVASAGSASVADADVINDPVAVRRRIGVVPQRANPDRSLNVIENCSRCCMARRTASPRAMPKYAAWKTRFSRTFRLLSGFGRCGTTPMRWRTSVGRVRTSAPSMIAVPDVGITRVVQMPIIVVFPAPLGPRRPKNSPECTSRSSDASATTSLLPRRSAEARNASGAMPVAPRALFGGAVVYTLRSRSVRMAASVTQGM